MEILQNLNNIRDKRTKLKYFLRLQKRKNTYDPSIVLLLMLSPNAIPIKQNSIREIPSYKRESYQIVQKGDFVICLTDMDGKLLYGISNYLGCISNLYNVFQIVHYNPRYILYHILYYYIQGLLRGYSLGTKYTLPLRELYDLQIHSRDREQQEKVVCHLDHTYFLTNTLIERIHALTALFKEYEKSIIYEYIGFEIPKQCNEYNQRGVMI